MKSKEPVHDEQTPVKVEEKNSIWRTNTSECKVNYQCMESQHQRKYSKEPVHDEQTLMNVE